MKVSSQISSRRQRVKTYKLIMYLYLSSKDTSGYHSSNTGTDFIITLPSSYYFSRTETWEIGLVDLYIENPDNTSISKINMLKLLDVYCDSVEPSVYNGSERKLLTVTRLKDCMRSIFTPSHIRYVELSQERLSNFHLYLKYHDGEYLTLPGLTSSCTLHIKRQGRL